MKRSFFRTCKTLIEQLNACSVFLCAIAFVQSQYTFIHSSRFMVCFRNREKELKRFGQTWTCSTLFLSLCAVSLYLRSFRFVSVQWRMKMRLFPMNSKSKWIDFWDCGLVGGFEGVSIQKGGNIYSLLHSAHTKKSVFFFAFQINRIDWLALPNQFFYLFFLLLFCARNAQTKISSN